MTEEVQKLKPMRNSSVEIPAASPAIPANGGQPAVTVESGSIPPGAV